MKIYYLKLFHFLIFALLLFSCGKEEFGITPRSNTSTAAAVKFFEQNFCAQPTEIEPKVDILYIVDNSTSTYYVSDDIKNAIKSMVDQISRDFDYRIIGTSLLPIDSTPNNDYQVLTNSTDALSADASSRKIVSSAQLEFFSAKVPGSGEAGLQRAIDFITENTKNNSGLFRKKSNLIIIMFSNGRDTQIESEAPYGSGETILNLSKYNEKLNSFKYIKTTLLESTRLRFISTTAHSSCFSGWLSSKKSYVKMSQDLYDLSGASDSPIAKDSYDLCQGISNVFTPINSSITKVIIQNKYRYWPITFATSNQVRNDFGTINVYTINNGQSTLLPSTAWTYYEHLSSTPLNLREPSSAGGEFPGKHFIRFNDLITSPTCVQVKSSTRTEYFGYIVLTQAPKVETLIIRINGKIIPKSTTNGWSYVGYRMDQNIKMPKPNPGDELPAINKTGFMVQLNGEENYYKSGDKVEADFIPSPI